MGNTTHTLGPWHAIEYCGYWSLQREGFYSDIDDLLNEERCKNAEANARLAAAAPELLKALEGLIDYVRRDGVLFHGLNKKELAYITKDAINAIAKATGEKESA